jgi:hypothetical protein
MTCPAKTGFPGKGEPSPLEQDTVKRDALREYLTQIDPDAPVFLDEAGFNLLLHRLCRWDKNLLVLDALCREGFFAEELVPHLVPDSVLVLDNASIHKGGQIEVWATAGCRILYLPAYSPHYNPIELVWSLVKRLVHGWRLHSVFKYGHTVLLMLSGTEASSGSKRPGIASVIGLLLHSSNRQN